MPEMQTFKIAILLDLTLKLTSSRIVPVQCTEREQHPQIF